MQDLSEHLAYLADTARLAQFDAALRAVVKPGDLVADLGCGSGILGMLALKAGAANVVSIDAGAMLAIARESFRRSGDLGRAHFVHGRSQRVEIPERADLAVCDHVGYLGLDYGIVDLLRDARQRLIKPAGQVMPRSLRLVLALVELDAEREAMVAWHEVPAEFRWLRETWLNTRHALQAKPAELIGGPAALGTVTLGEDVGDMVSWSAELEVTRDGLLNGLCGWFEAELAPGVWMTNSPVAARPIDRPQAFLPIEPVRVTAGARIRARLTLRPADELIAWDVEAGGRLHSHSTLFAAAACGDLPRLREARFPEPTFAANARAIVLALCDGNRSAAEVEAAVLRDHPALFPTSAEVRAFVAEVLRRDTRS